MSNSHPPDSRSSNHTYRNHRRDVAAPLLFVPQTPPRRPSTRRTQFLTPSASPFCVTPIKGGAGGAGASSSVSVTRTPSSPSCFVDAGVGNGTSHGRRCRSAGRTPAAGCRSRYSASHHHQQQQHSSMPQNQQFYTPASSSLMRGISQSRYRHTAAPASPATPPFMTPYTHGIPPLISTTTAAEQQVSLQQQLPPQHPATGEFRITTTPFHEGITDEDRYIPSRRRLNMDICRRALLSGEKRPRPPESSSTSLHPRQQQQQQQQQEQHTSNATDEGASSYPGCRVQSGTQETPLQKEFKRRMLSSLCNFPLEKLDEDARPTGILSFGRSSNQGLDSVASGSNAAYPFGKTGGSRRNLFQSNPFALDTFRTMKLGGMGSNVEDLASQKQVANKVVRKVPRTPIRILDAPDIVDDYYLNLISWSKENILAVALSRSVYLWNATTGAINHLITVEQEDDYITSVNWCPIPGQTTYIAVGTKAPNIHLFDCQTLRLIRTMAGHTSRVSALAWCPQQPASWLTSGARDAQIINHDVRVPNHIISKYTAHLQEVCGLKWSDDGNSLASGGNENFLCLWDAAMSGRRTSSSSSMPTTSRLGLGLTVPSTVCDTPRLILKQHKAAVKALDWCPFHRGLLASGGGTADRTIKFWNSSSGAMLNSIDTGSQVCSVLWSKNQRELCSSHGFSENQLIVWKYPTMTKIAELTGHTARVLNMDMSPDGSSIVSAGADETLRFWNIFERSNHRSSCYGGIDEPGMVSLLGGDHISFGGPTIR